MFERHFSNTFIEEETNPTSLEEIGRLEKYKRENPKPKKFFYDTEFLEGTQQKRFLGITYGTTAPTIDLISIGIVSDDGLEYYAVSKDFNLWEAWNRYDLKYTPSSGDMRNYFPEGSYHKEYWIRENVLKPIFKSWLYRGHELAGLPLPELKPKQFTYKRFKKFLEVFGKSRNQISNEIKDFITPIGQNPLDSVNLWGYYSDYDHVVFCWLFGKMLDLPDGFPMYSKDLKQSYDFYNKNFKKRKALNAVMPHLVNFESLKDLPDYPKQENEHNALADARWNKKLYEFLKAIK